jgi:hypothetical protein
MKADLSAVLLGVLIVVIYAVHYTAVVLPEQRDREALRAAMIATLSGDHGEARVQLTGQANSYFQPVK